MNVRSRAGSYRLLLHFPLMTFQPTLVGQCAELMMQKHTVHTYTAHAQTCSRCHTHRNTRWRWSGAACRLPGALSKSSPRGKRWDLQCLLWKLWVRWHTHSSTNTLFFRGAHLNLCNIWRHLWSNRRWSDSTYTELFLPAPASNTQVFITHTYTQQSFENTINII